MTLRGFPWPRERDPLLGGFRVIQWTALLVTAVLGFDYATGRPTPGLTVGNVEQILPAWAWALMFLVGSAFAAAGLLVRLPAAIILGHCVLVGAYASVGTAITYHSGWEGNLSTGFRLLVGGIAFHLVFAWQAAIHDHR